MLTDWEQPVRTHRGDSLLNSIVTTCLQACNSLRVFTCVGGKGLKIEIRIKLLKWTCQNIRPFRVFQLDILQLHFCKTCTPSAVLTQLSRPQDYGCMMIRLFQCDSLGKWASHFLVFHQQEDGWNNQHTSSDHLGTKMKEMW